MLGQGPCTPYKTLVQTPPHDWSGELLGRPSRGGWVNENKLYLFRL